jgi:hypothetical protein
MDSENQKESIIFPSHLLQQVVTHILNCFNKLFQMRAHSINISPTVKNILFMVFLQFYNVAFKPIG